MRDYYVKPYCRVAPYALGIACGMILFSYRHFQKTGKVYDSFSLWVGKSIDNRWVRYGFYIIGMALINFFIFIQYFAYKDVDNGWTSWSKAENILFIAFNRVGFGIGMSLVLMPMLFGHCKAAIMFMSNNIWTPFARVNFCTYLVHMNYVAAYIQSQKTAFWFSDVNVVVDLTFIIIISYSSAFVITLMIESPFMGFEKVLKARAARQRSAEKQLL